MQRGLSRFNLTPDPAAGAVPVGGAKKKRGELWRENINPKGAQHHRTQARTLKEDAAKGLSPAQDEKHQGPVSKTASA